MKQKRRLSKPTFQLSGNTKVRECGLDSIALRFVSYGSCSWLLAVISAKIYPIVFLGMNYKDDIYYKLLVGILKVYKYTGISLIILAFGVLIINFSPNIWYTIDASAVDNDTKSLLAGTSSGSVLKRVEGQALSNTKGANGQFTVARKLPDKDPSLPTTPTLIIEKIGVNAPIHRGQDGEKELEKGVWLPPEFRGPIEAQQQPLLLAAHRFGYVTWSNEFRKTNSFYNLPKLEPGDELTVIWDQRPFKYKVLQKYENKGDITIQSHEDLVLYTCKLFNSDVRIVVTTEKIN